MIETFKEQPSVPCQHIADYYQCRWEHHKCIAYNLLRQGYNRWAKGGSIGSANNLFGAHHDQ
jgi:hypothetical protein